MVVLQLLMLLKMMAEIRARVACSWDISSMRHGKLDCSSQKLHDVPILPSNSKWNITQVDFRNNSIADIPAYHFENISETLQILDLSHNQISALNKDSFHGLRHLEILKLGHNLLCLQSAYPSGLFKDLINLQTLFTLGNKCNVHPRGHQRYPDETFAYLTSLKRISLDIVSNFTLGVGFTYLTNLVSFEASGYDIGTSVAITNSSFSSLRGITITDLILRGHSFQSIHTGALQHFQHLETLNVACSSLGQFIMESIHGMTTPTLQTVIFDGVQVDYGIICRQNMNNVKQLSLRNTYITKDQIKALLKCTPSLEEVNFGANSFSNFFYINQFVLPNIAHKLEAHQYILPSSVNHMLQIEFSQSAFYTTRPIRTATVDISFGYTMYSVSENSCKNTEHNIADYFYEDTSVISLESWPYQGVYKIPEDLQISLNLSDGTIFLFVLSPSIASLSWTNQFAATYSSSQFISCPWVVFPFNTLVYLNISNNGFNTLP